MIDNRFARQIQRVRIIQGEFRVDDNENVVLSTVLGSCVAACLRDPAVCVGGMNHFLLPGSQTFPSSEGERYGAYLMEVLINELMKKGARRERIEAKLFGGARMVDGLSDIGALNARFAKEFLANEGIRIVVENLGGTHGRRVEYFPSSGRARQIFLPNGIQFAEPYKRLNRENLSGHVELF